MSVPLRVLIVEDSEDDALLIARELRQGGYDLTSERVDTLDDFEAELRQRRRHIGRIVPRVIELRGILIG